MKYSNVHITDDNCYGIILQELKLFARHSVSHRLITTTIASLNGVGVKRKYCRISSNPSKLN